MSWHLRFSTQRRHSVTSIVEEDDVPATELVSTQTTNVIFTMDRNSTPEVHSTVMLSRSTPIPRTAVLPTASPRPISKSEPNSLDDREILHRQVSSRASLEPNGRGPDGFWEWGDIFPDSSMDFSIDSGIEGQPATRSISLPYRIRSRSGRVTDPFGWTGPPVKTIDGSPKINSLNPQTTHSSPREIRRTSPEGRTPAGQSPRLYLSK